MSSWEPKRKVIQMGAALVVGLACMPGLVFAPEHEGLWIGVMAGALAVLGIGATRASNLLMAAISPSLAAALALGTLWGGVGCGGLGSVTGVEGDVQLVGEPEPTQASMGVTLTTTEMILGVGVTVGIGDPVDGVLCLDAVSTDGTVALSLCVRCDTEGNCAQVPSEPEPENDDGV